MSPTWSCAKYDGVGQTDRIGLNFTEVGTGVRGSVTMYDRGHSATVHMKPGDVDSTTLFAERGVRWLHTGGIFTALSDATAAVSQEALVKAAHEAGTIVSYDLNFRSKLWSSQKAQASHQGPGAVHRLPDRQRRGLPEGAGLRGRRRRRGKPRRTRHLRLQEDGRNESSHDYPNIKVVGTTLREVKTGLVNNWSAILWHDGKFYESRLFKDLEIEDRVGGGDGFASGFAYGFLTGMTPQECVNLGAAHGALLQTTRGDTSQIT